MNFEIMFYLLAAFIVGRLSTRKIYIGCDQTKYDEADFAIYLGK